MNEYTNRVHDEKVKTQTQRTYYLVHTKESRNTRVFISSTDNPLQACGEARHVGFTDRSERHKLYRLKVKVDYARTKRTIPELFVLDNNIFVNYEQWKQGKNEEYHSSL